MKRLYFYLSMFVCLLVVACRQDAEIGVNPDLKSGEYLFSVTLPEPLEAVSRAMGDVVSLDGKELHVLVFDKNGFFVANQTASSVNQSNGKYTYKVELPPSEEPRSLHFILGNVGYPTFVPDDSESSVFSNLSVSGNEDAYWQRVTVPKIAEGMNLGDITLIRNFAKISVESKVENSNFEFKGFALVRNTDAGTVAPYVGPDMVENGGFALFDTADDYDTFVSKNHGYGGDTAGDVDETVPDDGDFTMLPKYMYERNQDEAQRPAYVLVKAFFFDGGVEKECYYKLDIVRTDDQTWITSYLNIYRNFHYTIRINKVMGAGYATPEEAMQATASNNIGASVEVSQVNTIQDGLGNELWVSTLDTLIVTANNAEIYYRYTTGMNSSGSGGTVSNEQVKVTPVSDSEDGVNRKAISDWNYSDGVLTVTPANLPSLMETQEFILATSSGLARRVVIRVRQPFRLRVDCDKYVERKIGAQLTLAVILPQNMPTAVFPLTLDIEPERKSLYPDVNENRIPVNSEGNHTFSYRAEVSYADYMNSRTCHFVFKTNIASSATDITVTNPYFEEIDNVASFLNEGDQRYNFGRITLNDSENEYIFDKYETVGEKLILQFDLHTEGDGYQPEGTHPINIYPTTPERVKWDNVKSSTGTVEIVYRENGNFIVYTPKDVYSRQEVIFESAVDFATGTFQLSANDHATKTIGYKVKPLQVYAEYNSILGQSPVNGNIDIYKNDYNGDPILTYKAQRGYFTINSFGGVTMDDTWCFRYQISILGSTINYECSKSIPDLISNPNILLESDW